MGARDETARADRDHAVDNAGQVGSSGPSTSDAGIDRPVRPRFVLVLVGWAIGIPLFFVADNQGYLLGKGSLFQAGLVALVAASIFALFLRPHERLQFCLTAVLAVCVAVPIARIANVPQLSIGLFLVAITALTAVGVTGGRSTISRQGAMLVGLLMGGLAVSTVLAGTVSGILKLALSMIPALAAFLLAGRLDVLGRRVVSIAIVSLGAVEAMLAIVEPIAFPRHLWAAAQVQSDGLVATADNAILIGMQRSQGTLGHALPLGFLLVLALALLLRVVEPPLVVKWMVAAVFLVAIIFAGSRNSLILCTLLLLFFPPRKLTSVRLIWAALLAAILIILGVMVGFLSFGFIDDFAASGSYTHRASVLDAFGQLLTRQSILRTAIGNGFGSIPSLFAQGLLQTDGFNVVDNQFVATLAQGGVIAMLALVVLTVRPLFSKGRHWRAAVLVILVNCMVYDWLTWPSSAALAFFVYGCVYAATAPPGQSNDAAPSGDEFEVGALRGHSQSGGRGGPPVLSSRRPPEFSRRATRNADVNSTDCSNSDLGSLVRGGSEACRSG